MKGRTLAYASLLTVLCATLSVLTLLSGCRTLADLNIANPSYSLRNIRPRVDIAIPLSSSSIDLEFDLAVDNPNSVGLRLDRVDFDLLINGSQILRSTSSQRISIPARGRGDVFLRTRIGYREVRSMFRELADVIQGNRARYELRGNAYYNTPVGNRQFPVTVFSTR